MTDVVAVLRSGGVYDPSYVVALSTGLREHAPEGTTLTVLSDVDLPDLPNVRPVSLEHDWPGWWSLVEWYRPGLFEGRVVAVGLDTLFVDDLSPLLDYDGPFAGIVDLGYVDRPPHQQVLASGVMAWEGDEAAGLYAEFRADPKLVMRRNSRHDVWLRKVAGDAARLQDHLPENFIVSYKYHARGELPEGAAVVCLHGRPRPADPKAGWAHKLWRERGGER